MLYSLLKTFAVPLAKILFRIETKGTEFIPQRGGFILASNHVSYLDPVVLGIACPRQLNFMARHDLFINPFFRWLIVSLGAFPVKRNSADASALKEAIRRLRQGKGLVVFPQGTRKAEDTGIRPQAGVGFLAVKSGVPVIPVFIRGAEVALPKGAKMIRPCRVSVQFGRQISIERRMPYQEISQRIMNDIEHLACL